MYQFGVEDWQKHRKKCFSLALWLRQSAKIYTQKSLQFQTKTHLVWTGEKMPV